MHDLLVIELRMAALFSGGMGSIYSLYLCQMAELEVERLVTARARPNSRMYHASAVPASEIAAQALGMPRICFDVSGEEEIDPLRDALAPLEIEGLCFGAVSDSYLRSRVARTCEDLGLDLIAPLWHKDPVKVLTQMTESGFKIMIVKVARGLGEKWLGSILDREHLPEFFLACDKNRFHPTGEGGEYETLVLSGPNMQGSIEPEFEKMWRGDSGELKITGARLVGGRKEGDRLFRPSRRSSV